MDSYETKEVLVLAKRYNNTKRSYLLINPLQAKHMPAIPSEALKMMKCLGEKIAKKYPTAGLVIGFAETATAIATVVSECIGGSCRLFYTTRESDRGLLDWIYFNEEHSHAVEQKLFTGGLERWIRESQQIIIVDDEISTGKTLLNMVEQLRTTYPDIRSRQIIAASIINRLSPENEARFRESGVESEYLVKLDEIDFSKDVAGYNVKNAESIEDERTVSEDEVIHLQEPLPDPRFGVSISDYTVFCRRNASSLSQSFFQEMSPNSEILVLGTEECMYPALILAEQIEKDYMNVSVRCHATTRSPIGICDSAFYPIQTGYKLHSFYEEERDTYIYNLNAYDIAVVFTDSTSDDRIARADLSMLLHRNGCKRVVFVEGGRRV